MAGRGKIAFRAAYEPGAETIAVLPSEDRESLHRQKAAEPYRIGEPGHPVRLPRRRGDRSVLDTADHLSGLRPGVEHVVGIDRGVQLFIALEAIGEPDEKGVRTVLTTLNGQVRPVSARDRRIAVTVRSAEEADPGRAGSRRRSSVSSR